MKIVLNEKQVIYVLREALDLSVAKEYVKIQRSPQITEKINHIFDLLRQKYPNTKTSKRGDRLYIPFGSQLKDEISDALNDNDFDISDYDKGLAINRRNGQELKIGKALTRIKREDLLTKYTTDKSKGAIDNPSGYMVYSKHPYDIASMSTGRDWTSCMNLETGSNRRYVSCDITEGSFVVYLIDANDLNINNPKGRMAIKPFINQMDKNDIIFFPESRSYGSVPSEFQDEIEDFFKQLNTETQGVVYNKNERLYNDSNSLNYTNLSKIKTVEDVENVIFNVDDRTKKDLALANKLILDYVMSSPRINHYVKESIVNESKFEDISKYLTSEYLLGFGSSGGLDDLIDRFPQLKEVIRLNSKPFIKKFPSVFLKFFPEELKNVPKKDILALSDGQLFDIFEYNPDFFSYFYDNFKNKIISSSVNTKRLYYFLESHPKYLIKAYPIFRKPFREMSDYDKNKFISKTLKYIPGLFNFYLYNEKDLLDKFFDEPTTTNEIAYRNNGLFYLVFKNYPGFVNQLVEDDLLKMMGLNESLIPFFLKYYREDLLNLDKHEVYKFLYYHDRTIPIFLKNLPEFVKQVGEYLLGNLMNYHPEHAEEIQKIL
jgi:hypothetical protein